MNIKEDKWDFNILFIKAKQFKMSLEIYFQRKDWTKSRIINWKYKLFINNKKLGLNHKNLQINKMEDIHILLIIYFAQEKMINRMINN
jgi:hypothetical protein